MLDIVLLYHYSTLYSQAISTVYYIFAGVCREKDLQTWGGKKLKSAGPEC